MPIALAVCSAVIYGTSDFLGGILTRRYPPWSVVVVVQTSSAVSAFVFAFLIPGNLTASDFVFALGAGLCGGLGMGFLYRGLSTGRMSVIAPVSALGTAFVPVVVGIVQGDDLRRYALAGIAFIFPAIYLISKTGSRMWSQRTSQLEVESGSSTIYGVAAGLGLGLSLAFLGQIGSTSGMIVVAIMQTGSAAVVVTVAMMLKVSWIPSRQIFYRAWPIGSMNVLGIGSFLYATHSGRLSIVAVIASLYPAVTVLLAAALLKDRVNGIQAAGLALGTTAVVLIVIG